MIVTAVLSWLFYDNLLFVVPLFPVFVLLTYKDIQNIKAKQSKEKLLEFQNMLMVLSQSLQVGNSVENAFINAAKELEKIHGHQSVVMKSLYKITHGLDMNVPVEKVVSDMAEAVNEEEVHLFASVFYDAKRSGLNMIEVISFTTNSLLEKIRIKRETEMIVSAKKTEQNIMSVVPMGILLYIKICSGDFIASLYHNMSGILIMTGLLIVYLIAYLWSGYIMEIEV